MYYEVYKDNSGKWRWRLVAANSRIIATSGEGYTNHSDCLDAIDLVKSSQDAPILTQVKRAISLNIK
jgi:uncharacterized protein YegP (UPF0339 family)